MLKYKQMCRICVKLNQAMRAPNHSIYIMFVCLVWFWQQAHHHKRVLVPKENKFHSVWLQEMGIGELMHECFPKHPCMGTARQKLGNETEEESKKRRINAERSTADTKERSPVQSPCRVVTSVTHDIQSRSPTYTMMYVQ